MLSKIILFQIVAFQNLLPHPTTTTPPSDSTRQLQELIVTGNYKPQGLDKSVIATRNLVIDRLASVGVQNVADVLKYQPNIRLQQDNILGTGLSMQGISGENVKILMDGVPVIGRQGGNIDLTQLNVQNIERIELIEGPMSVQYGTNALAGTLNIITKKKKDDGIGVNINTYAESVGHLNVGSTLGWRENGQTLNISMGRNFFNGWSNIDTSRFKDWKPKVQYFADVNYQTSIGNVKLGYSGNYFTEFILNRGRPLNPYFETAFDDKYNTTRLSNALNASFPIKNQLAVNVLVSYSNYTRTKNTFYRNLVSVSETMTENGGDQDTTQFNLFATRGTVARTKGKTLNYEAGFDINVETGGGLRIKDKTQQIGDYAGFVSAEWRITEGVTLRPGLRASYNSTYAAPLIPSLHIRYAINNDWTARASYGSGFRAPSLKELYFFFVDINHNIQGNPNLKAERSANFNGVVNYKKAVGSDRVYKFEASTFLNNISNLISLAIISGGDNAYSYVNIDQFKTYGGQVFGEATFKNLNIGTGIALTRRENNFSNQIFNADTWEWRANATMTNIAKTGIDANFWFKHSGKQPNFVKNEDGAIQPNFVGAYNLADAGLSRRFLKNKLNTSIGVRNLFDIRNVQAQLSSGSGHQAGSNTTALATGRTVFMKFDIKF
jgi:outer membrane receptor for ferrienterochelin and colicins